MSKAVIVSPERILHDLIADCKSATTEFNFSVQDATISWYHYVGCAIIQSRAMLPKNMTMESLLVGLSDGLHKSVRTLNYAIAIASTYPTLEDLRVKFPGKNASITHVKAEMEQKKLVEKEDKEPKKRKCPECGYEW